MNFFFPWRIPATLAAALLLAACSGSDSATVSATDYTVAGTVSGLSGTLVLQNNGGDDLTVTAVVLQHQGVGKKRTRGKSKN